MTLGLLNVGPFELLLLVAVAVMLFGGDLPDAARKAGRLVARLRATASELGRAVYEDGDPRAELPPRRPGGAAASAPPPEARLEPPGEMLGDAPDVDDGMPAEDGGSVADDAAAPGDPGDPGDPAARGDPGAPGAPPAPPRA